MYSKAEASQIRRNFWVGFDEFSRPYLGKHGKWMTYNTGIKFIELKFVVDRSCARVMLSVESNSEDKRLEIFCKLYECELVLKGFIGEGWTWDESFVLENGKSVCAIYKQIDDVDIYRSETWPTVYKFFADNMLGLEKAIVEIRPFFEEFVKGLK